MSCALLLDKPTVAHLGYQVTEVCELAGPPIGWENMERLQRVPRKISAFFDRKRIQEVRRFNTAGLCFQYFIRTCEGKFVEALY